MTEFKHKLILYSTIVFLVVFIFIQRSCTAQTIQNTTKQKVWTKEKKGEFPSVTAIIKESNKKDSIVYRNKVVKTENPFNKKLAEDFIASQKENDSLKALKLYLNAIEEKEKTYTFDNKDVTIEVYTKTRGDILKITPKYTLKSVEHEVEVLQKETVFAAFAGVGLETTTTLERLTPEVSVGFQNKKGTVLLFKYGITDKSVGVSYIHRFINIKK